MMQLYGFAALGAILVGVVILLSFSWKKLLDRRTGDPSIDERKERIDGKAARYSIFATISAINVMCIFYGSIMIIFNFPFDPLIGITLLIVVLVMASSFIGFRWLFNRKGDFE